MAAAFEVSETTELLDEEAETIEAIYGDEATIIKSPAREVIIELRAPTSSAGAVQSKFHLRLLLGESYPHVGPPSEVELLSAPSLGRDARAAITQAAIDAWVPGEPSLYAMIEAAREAAETQWSAQIGSADSSVHKSGGGHGDSTPPLDASTADNAAFVFYPPYPKYGQRPRKFDSASANTSHAVEIVCIPSPLLRRLCLAWSLRGFSRRP